LSALIPAFSPRRRRRFRRRLVKRCRLGLAPRGNVIPLSRRERVRVRGQRADAAVVLEFKRRGDEGLGVQAGFNRQRRERLGVKGFGFGGCWLARHAQIN